MPLFGKSSKSPVELIRGLKESLLTLEKGSDGKKQDKAQEDVSKHLQNITSLLFGSDNEQQSDIVLAQLSQEIYNRWKKANAIANVFKVWIYFKWIIAPAAEEFAQNRLWGEERCCSVV